MKKLTLFILLLATQSWAADPISFTGDFRVREQYQKQEADAAARNRFRLRMRLAGMAGIDDQTKVNVRLATGATTEPRSNNQTLEDSFAKPGIVLDYAFIEHSPINGLTVLAGKMKNPIWNPTDVFAGVLWDADLTPDGVALAWKSTGNESFLNAGYFVLDEIGKTDPLSPYLIALQPGIHWEPMESIAAKTAVEFYWAGNVKGRVLPNSAKTNSTTVDFYPVILVSEFKFPMIKAIGEIGFNGGASSENKLGLIGLVFGNENWQGKIQYSYIQKDAWLDILPDSDALGGITDIQGFRIGAKFVLSKASAFDITYYSMNRISAASNRDSLIQVDLSTKF